MKILKSPRLADCVLQRLPEKNELKQIFVTTEIEVCKAVSELTLTEWLWRESASWADKALNTEFIQGMKAGTLDPNDFGIYNMQDSVYCYNATNTLSVVERRSNGPIKEYAEEKRKSYEEYTEDLFKLWYIKDPNAVIMGKAATAYSDYELWVAKELDPIYSFIAMIPCSRLWPWLGGQLAPYKDTFGVYRGWIEENLTGSGYKSLEAFVTKHSRGIDRQVALDVYSRCMQGEAEFFASAVINL